MENKEQDFTALESKLGVCGGLFGIAFGAILGWFVFAPLLAKKIAPLADKLGGEVFERVVTKQQRPGFLDSEDGRKKLADYPEHAKQRNLGAAQIICVLGGGFVCFVVFGWLCIFIARMIE